MDRAEQVGLGVAAAGHVALFALLSASFLVPKKDMPVQPPMDVSLVDQVALEAAAPTATEAPAASRAPEVGPPEDAAPPAPAQAAPAPEPVPPSPQPSAAPPPKPSPVAKPQPTPQKPAPPAPEKARTPPKPAAATSQPPAKPTQTKGTGTQVAAAQTRPRGGSLGDVMKGIVAEAEPQARGQIPRAATLNATALAGIQDAIRRQIQPCADRQVDPGPGANEISTVLNLRFNVDGTLSTTPTVVRQSDADGENARYKQRVVDLGIAALRACSPLRLPPEFYRTAAGGWSNINFIWKLR